MKRIEQKVFALTTSGSMLLAAVDPTRAAEFAWDGGTDSNYNWSDAENWNPNIAPGGTGHTLSFGGSAGLASTNDGQVTSLVNNATAGRGAITFETGAGNFTLNGTPISWETNANGRFVYNLSGGSHVLNLGFADATAGNTDRGVNANGGTLAFNGNINFGNDRLFAEGTAGTIILAGNNSGDGTGNALTGGTNALRSVLRNNVANSHLVLGSNTALGNSGTGSIAGGNASFRGLIANQSMTLATQGGDRDLSGSSVVINAANVTYNGASNLTLGNLIVQGGNRDFVVSSTGRVSVQNEVALSHDATGRNLYLNTSGTGGMVINGAIHDTFLSTGISGNSGQLRKAGAGTLVLNGTSAYRAATSIEGGTLLLNGTHEQGTGVNAGRYVVASGALLGGGGTINLSDTTGTLTGLSVFGTLAPGAGIGTLTVNGSQSTRSMIAIEPGGTLLWELNTGLASDVLALTGAQPSDLLFNDTVINFSDLSGGALTPGSYTLITADAANAYSGLTIADGTITAGLTIGTGLEAYAESTLRAVGNDIVLTVAVPEPAGLGLLALGGVLLGRRRRRA